MTTGGADKSPCTAGFERSGRTNCAARIAIAADPRIVRNAPRPVTASARDNLAFDRAVAEVVEERVGAGRERREVHGYGLSRLHDALAMQLETLKLYRRIAGVGHLQFDRSVGGESQVRGLDGASIKAEL